MEGPWEPWWLAPWATLFLLYSLVILTTYVLEVASLNLLIQATGPLLPPPLSAAWFGYQATTDVIFTVFLPLALTWTRSCWPLGGPFCRLDPGLAFLTFHASGRLLAHVAADRYTSLLQPAWALGHRLARRVVLWVGWLWLLLLGLGGLGLRGSRDRVTPAHPSNGTPAKPGLDARAWGSTVDQLAFGFGVPLGVLSVFHSLVEARLRLAALTGRPPLLGLPAATGAMVFLCWFPFHLLLLLKLLGTWEAGLDLGDVWVLLRPLGFTLLGASGCLNPLLYVGNRAFRRQLCQVLWSCRGGMSEEETGAQAVQAEPSCAAGT